MPGVDVPKMGMGDVNVRESGMVRASGRDDIEG
jgi:hypothetical protein